MKTGRIPVPPAMAAGVTPSRYPGMPEPFFETGGCRRHGGRLVPGDRRRRPGPGLFLQIRAPALAIGGAGHPGHRTRRATGGAGWGLPVCPA